MHFDILSKNNLALSQETCYYICKKGRDSLTTSARLQEIILDLLADKKSHSVQEMKIHLEQSGATAYSEGQFAGSLNTLLRNKTIIKIDRAIYKLAKESRGANNMKYCFVVSPIGEEGSEIRANADKLLKHIISPVCQSCGLSVERVDQINDSDSITQTIIDKLLSADLVIADISGHNPNVFYEIGYRKCTGKPIVHLKCKGERLPFDVNTIRTFEYDLTDLDNVEAIKERLQQTIAAISFEAADEPEENANDKNGNTVSGLLPILYQIQDSIADLKNEIAKKDNETLQTIMQTSLNNAAKAESTDATMMKLLLPELLRNPDSFSNFMKIAEMANNAKKK